MDLFLNVAVGGLNGRKPSSISLSCFAEINHFNVHKR